MFGQSGKRKQTRGKIRGSFFQNFRFYRESAEIFPATFYWQMRNIKTFLLIFTNQHARLSFFFLFNTCNKMEILENYFSHCLKFCELQSFFRSILHRILSFFFSSGYCFNIICLQFHLLSLPLLKV